jgi:hypothetical protein
LATATWCGKIKDWDKIPEEKKYATMNGLNKKLANALENGAGPLKDMRDKTYTAEIERKPSKAARKTAKKNGKPLPAGNEKMTTTLHPFNAPGSGALIVSSGVTKDGLFVGGNKPAPDVNQDLNNYAKKTVQENFQNGKKASEIKDKWVNVNQQDMEEKAEKAEKLEEADKQAVSSGSKWNAKSNNLHGEDLTVANIGKATSRSDGTPGPVGDNVMMSTVSSDKTRIDIAYRI